MVLAWFSAASGVQAQSAEPEIVHFRSGELTLGGEFFKPAGPGPFKAVVFNHGGAEVRFADVFGHLDRYCP